MFEFKDKTLGRVVVKVHHAAKQIIGRKYSDRVELTVPPHFQYGDLPDVLRRMTPKFVASPIHEKPQIYEHTELETFTFRTRLRRTGVIDELLLNLSDNVLTISMPHSFDLNKDISQHLVKQMIEHVLRQEAKRVLTKKTLQFAKKHNLTVCNVKINNSKGRWGSCSAQKNINFSYFLMLFPEKFIDYVVLHELAHTKEMNHSITFWRLLDKLCGCDAKTLQQEMNKYNSETLDIMHPRGRSRR